MPLKAVLYDSMLIPELYEEVDMFMIPEFFQVFITGLMIVIPVCVIYKKAGFHPGWAGLVFLPGFGLLLIFLQLALVDWPNSRRRMRKLP